MSEETHAQVLAQWLDADAGVLPPDGLDEEVLGTIYALRPERAPPHRVRLEDVLGTLLTGPLADPEVAEAAIALNPDLAPMHRVGIDEILDAVTEGPFAKGAEVVDLAAARRRRRLWVGAGAFAAAAMAMFIVIPISHRAGEAPIQSKEDAPLAKKAEKTKKAKKAKRAQRTAAASASRIDSKQMRAEAEPARGRSAAKLAPGPRDYEDADDRETRGRFGSDQDSEASGLLGTRGQGPGGGGLGTYSGGAGFPAGQGSTGQRPQAPPSADLAPAPAREVQAIQARDADRADEAELDSMIVAQESSVERKKRKDRRGSAARQAPAVSAGTTEETRSDHWAGYPDTRKLRAARSRASHLRKQDPNAALKKLRQALKEFTRVHPDQLRQATLLEAEILDQLGRTVEAAAARKKANEIKQAN